MKAVLFDIDGVLLQQGVAIAGAQETLAWLQQNSVPFRCITNTTSRDPAQIAAELQAQGLAISAECIFNPAHTAAVWLQQEGIRHLELLVPDGIRAAFAAFDCSGQQPPQALVVGDIGEGFSYAVLNRLFRLLMDNPDLPLLALGMTRYFATADGLQLDAGPFIRALEYASGRAALVMGKPDRTVFELALADLGLEPRQVVMIGDDCQTDVLAAQALGIIGVLVRSGKYRPGDELSGGAVWPDYILDSVAALPALLQRQHAG